MKYYLGMDIGGTKCAVVLAEKGSVGVKDKIRFDTKSERGWRTVVGELVSCARELLERNQISAEDVLSCGVSCGGPLNSETGVIMCPPNLPDWDNVPLSQIVTDELGIACRVRNDADACALAEWQFGAGRGCKNMIFLTFGTGMGAGLILNGKLYDGTTGTAGEVGHMRIDSDGPVGYGKAGSFEGFCSGAGIAAMTRKMLPLYSGETVLNPNDISAKTVAQAATGGDAFARAIYRRCGEKLGLGLSILIDILNPEKIVIGSIFARSSHLLIESMEEVIKKEALPASAACCKIVPAMLGDEIGDYAALGVAKELAEG